MATLRQGIISRRYARRLVKAGRARVLGLVNVGSQDSPVLYINIQRDDYQTHQAVMTTYADRVAWFNGEDVTNL